ncbi:MAG TPA: hypothetical protein GX715_08335 [Armatimonadetes bacterium]|jgi:hypothetical protein|nr:hypothetical protein [Armatimonadota bacterium]
MRKILVLSMIAVALATVQGWCAQGVSRQELGRTVKLTILVDKVMQPVEGWVTKEWMIKAAADAGFNVFSPRRGHERLQEVRDVTEWCRKYGIYHMPWMRGTLEAPKGPEADGKRVVWASGNEQPLWSPNSDEFWEWTARYIVEYAKISANNKHLMGVFLDYENYAPGKEGNLYSLSYDDVILKRFAQARGIEIPKLELGARKSWLEEQKLHEEFERFQIAHWRERCRALRQAVDRHDPTFQFCIYPGPGTPFMLEAALPEWSTAQAPIILADPWIYGRPSRFLPQAEALEANRRILQRGIETAKAKGVPFLYAGGIDPVVPGADPEFSGKNAVMSSETTDGYWIFYEGPTYTKQDHADYWKWFTWANHAIAGGRLNAWREPRQTEEDWSLTVFKDPDKLRKLILPQVTGKRVKFPEVTLRGENLLVLAAKAGQPVELTLQNVLVGKFPSPLIWELRDASMQKLTSGTIPGQKEGKVRFTPQKDGVYLLGASAGSSAYRVVSANVPVGLFAGEDLSLIFGAPRLYFQVPQGIDRFTLRATGSGGETVRVTVHDPAGKEAATGQTSLRARTASIPVSTAGHAGKVWSLAILKADEGVLEDNKLRLDAKLPPLLSFVPEHVFSLRD